MLFSFASCVISNEGSEKETTAEETAEISENETTEAVTEAVTDKRPAFDQITKKGIIRTDDTPISFIFREIFSLIRVF